MIDCKFNVERRLQHLADYVKVNDLTDKKLAVLQVGDNPASNSYIKGKKKDADKVGITVHHIKYENDITTDKIIEDIKQLNNNDDVLGIIVQMPIPEHLDKEKIISTIIDNKDVDGFKKTSPFLPCTPLGIISILDDIKYDVKGRTVCILGQGHVGRPLTQLLMDRGATIVSCNSKTPLLQRNCYMRTSDVLISAVGRKDLVLPGNFWDMFSQRYEFPEVMIDVGINRDENGKLCGDFSPELYDYVEKITPVPGGVGLYTRVSLLENTIYK